MLEQLRYVNHQNEILEFGKSGIYINESDIHDFAWSYAMRGKRIAGFSKEVEERKLPVVIVKDIMAKNALYEICEKDVIANRPGKLYCGEYYMRCYVTASKKSRYLLKPGILNAELTVLTDYPYWVRESNHEFLPRDLVPQLWLNYPHNYPHNFGRHFNVYTLNNDSFIPCDFRLSISGPVSAPAIMIGAHEYNFSTALAAGDVLSVESASRKIALIHLDGRTENRFSDRDKTPGKSAFEKIPAGGQPLSWSESFGFNLTLFEVRSEPKWT
jgi:hypothetical protein